MKKSLSIVFALLAVASLYAAPVLVEAYNEETTMSSPGDTAVVIELSFSVDTSCYTLFTAGGVAMQAKMFLALDGENLFPTSIVRGAVTYSTHIAYTYPLGLGSHTVRFMMTDNAGSTTAVCLNAYLQALIFLPDEPDAVAEQPPGDNPQPQARSVVSQGPWVSAPGATELVDAMGRTINNAITDNRVQISALPAGTYFARSGGKTVVKVVVIE
jgi:hypothetical protein